MNTEVVTSPEHDIHELISKLRSLLTLPKRSRPADWDIQLAPIVGILSVDYAKQENPGLALTELALLTLAGLVGSKEAKRRVIPVKWTSKPPSVLELLSNVGERKAAITGLARARFEWVAEYAICELGHPEAKPLRSDLFAWALRNVEDWTAIVRIVQANITTLRETCPEVLKCLVDAARADGMSSVTPGTTFLSALVDLVIALKSLPPIASKGATAKFLSSCLINCSELMDIAISSDPSQVFRPGFAAMLSQLSLGKVGPKALSHRVDRIAQRAVAIFCLVYDHGSPEARSDVSRHSRSIAASNSNFLEQIQRAIRSNRSLGNMLEEAIEDHSFSTYQVEDLLCSLIPEVDELAKLHPEDALAAQIQDRLGALAKAVHVERFGREGEIQPFDPFRHLLTEDISPAPANVRIERPGLALSRSDGSTRVLLKSVVTAVSD